MLICNPKEYLDKALEQSRKMAKTGSGEDIHRAKPYQHEIFKTTHDYQKFLNCISKIFQVQPPCCAVRAKGLLTGIGEHPDYMLYLEGLYFTYNANLTYGTATFGFLRDLFEEVIFDRKIDNFKVASLIYSRVMLEKKSLAFKLNQVLKKFSKNLSKHEDPRQELLDNFIENLEAAREKLEDLQQNYRKKDYNFAAANNQIQELLLKQDFMVIMQMLKESFDKGEFNYKDTDSVRIENTLKVYNDYIYSIEFIREFAVERIYVPGWAEYKISTEYLKEEQIEGKGAGIHSEMQQWPKLFEENVLPYIGVSLLCCGMCYHTLNKLAEANGLEIKELVPGTHGIFYPEDWVVIENFPINESDKLDELALKSTQYAQIVGQDWIQSYDASEL